MTALKILRIEVDGHFHGSSSVPKPWVAQIDGVDAKYGLARTFVQRLNDYRDAKRAWSGRVNGVVAAFPLHEGRLYEVSRLRGRSSKRYVAREFLVVEDGKFHEIEPTEALAMVEPYAGPTLQHIVPDGTTIARVDGLGTPTVCGFVLVGPARDERLYRLRVGTLHEVDTGTERYLILPSEHRADRISQTDAITHLIREAA